MPLDFDDETLVAYLDGELPSEQVAAVEQELKSDPELQQRVQSLRAAWELLLELPDDKPTRDIAQSTIEIITLDLERKSQSWWRRAAGNRFVLILGLALGALILGAGAGKTFSGRIRNQLLEDLPTVVNYRSLENIDDVTWLKTLAGIDDLVDAGDSLLEINAGYGPKLIGPGVVPVDSRDRAMWVEALDETDRNRLEDRLQAFFAESADRKIQLREMSEEIYRDREQTAHMLKTIRAYSAILNECGTRQANDLKGLPLEQRKYEVQQRVARILWTNYAAKLSNADKRAYMDWLYDLRWDDELMDADIDLEDPLLVLAAEDSLISEKHINRLTAKLSPYAQHLLELVDKEEDRRLAIGFWGTFVVRPDSQAKATVSKEQLEQKFSELRREEQEFLELLPAEKTLAELKRKLGVPTSSSKVESEEAQ